MNVHIIVVCLILAYTVPVLSQANCSNSPTQSMLTEWTPQTINRIWNINQTCQTPSECLLPSNTSNILRQICPVTIGTGSSLLLSISSGLVNASFPSLLWVNESEWRSCSVSDVEAAMIAPVGTVKMESATSVQYANVTSGQYYLIDQSQCSLGGRLSLMVFDTSACTGSTSSADACSGNGACVPDTNDGNFKCSCEPGFSDSLCGTYDGCWNNPCSANQTCVSASTNSSSTSQNGNYTCFCEGIPCTSVPQVKSCGSGFCPSDATCVNTPSTTHSCVCGSTASDPQCTASTSSCEGFPCLNNGTCSTANSTMVECSCTAQYTGQFCEVFVDVCQGHSCHQGICVGQSSGPQCFCRNGWTGINCDRNYNDCSSGPCKNGGVCTDEVGNVTCACALGFTGFFCDVNIDDCTNHSCTNGGICVDGINNYTCSCPNGFTGSLCEIDIDECATNPCNNDGTCSTEIVAEFSCSCKVPFAGPTCSQLACDLNPCENGGNCTNDFSTNPGFTCACPTGFEGTQCQTNIDDCAAAAEAGPLCSDRGQCIDGLGDITCLCEPGWVGDICEVPVDDCVGHNCTNNATCFDLVNDFRCDCLPGWGGSLCESEINECLSSPCTNNGTCVDHFNRFSCKCPPGYAGLNCSEELNECFNNECSNGSTCFDIVNGYTCVCPPFRTGPICDTVFDPCSSGNNECVNNATCQTHQNGTFTCVCNPGFEGFLCEVNTNECAANPCQFNGTCVDKVNGYECLCVEGATGSDCETDINDCLPNPCSNGGTCVDQLGGYECNCNLGFSGKNCSEDVNECLDISCQNGGTCINSLGNFTCSCPVGFEGTVLCVVGSVCQVNIDDCSSTPCLNGGICEDRIASYECLCPNGWTGINCQQDVDECFDSPCSFGQCENFPGDYNCTCNEGFEGRNCTDNINECLVTTCLNDGTCVDSVGSFECQCTAGFTGPLCQLDIDVCQAGNVSQCRNGGSCQEGTGLSFTCVCAAGFSGTFCELNVNECQPNPCANNSSLGCTDLVNDYQCACLTGWTGKNCSQDIAECAVSPCVNGVCEENVTPPGLECFCTPGFGGELCSVNFDECIAAASNGSAVCQNGGTCIDGVISYTCNCLEGFTGSTCQLEVVTPSTSMVASASVSIVTSPAVSIVTTPSASMMVSLPVSMVASPSVSMAMASVTPSTILSSVTSPSLSSLVAPDSSSMSRATLSPMPPSNNPTLMPSSSQASSQDQQTAVPPAVTSTQGSVGEFSPIASSSGAAMPTSSSSSVPPTDFPSPDGSISLAVSNPGIMSSSPPASTGFVPPTLSLTPMPSSVATPQPSSIPTPQPSSIPTPQPSSIPTPQPSSIPTPQPSSIPTPQPSSNPTPQPSSIPTPQPSSIPTPQPSSIPTPQPSSIPTPQPSSIPTPQPSSIPTPQPSSIPTPQPSSIPTPQPSSIPTPQLSSIPTPQPSSIPTPQPSSIPTPQPSSIPTPQPSSILSPPLTLMPSSPSSSQSPTNVIPSATPVSSPSPLATVSASPVLSNTALPPAASVSPLQSMMSQASLVPSSTAIVSSMPAQSSAMPTQSSTSPVPQTPASASQGSVNNVPMTSGEFRESTSDMQMLPSTSNVPSSTISLPPSTSALGVPSQSPTEPSAVMSTAPATSTAVAPNPSMSVAIPSTPSVLVSVPTSSAMPTTMLMSSSISSAMSVVSSVSAVMPTSPSIQQSQVPSQSPLPSSSIPVSSGTIPSSSATMVGDSNATTTQQMSSDALTTPTTGNSVAMTTSAMATTLSPSTLAPVGYLLCSCIVCENGGTCQDTVDSSGRNSFQCQCPLPYGGLRCELELTIVYPQFHKESALRVPVQTSNVLEVSFSFVATSSGILFSGVGPRASIIIFVGTNLETLQLQATCDGTTNNIGGQQFNSSTTTTIDIMFSCALNDTCRVDWSVDGNNVTWVDSNVLPSGASLDISNLYFGQSPARPNFLSFTGCLLSMETSTSTTGLSIVDQAGDGTNVRSCDLMQCSGTMCQNGGVCSTDEEGWFCDCPSVYSGTYCEHTSCSSNPCYHGATCVPYESSDVANNRYDTNYICICPYGYHGVDCSKALVTIEAPQFNPGVMGYSSYIEYQLPVGFSAGANFTMTFSLGSSSAANYSLLAFTGQYYSDSRGDDYMVLAVERGYIVFLYDLGSGPASIQSASPLFGTDSADGMKALRTTHVVIFGRTGRDGWLKVDNQQTVVGSSAGSFTHLNSRSGLFVGGISDNVKSTFPTGFADYTGLQGCVYSFIQKGVADTAYISPTVSTQHMMSGRNVQQCSASECLSAQCSNSGTCVDLGASFRCDCPSGWTGLLCEEPVTIAMCDDHLCADGATCLPSTDSFKCLCPLGRTGMYCNMTFSISEASFVGEKSYLAFEVSSSIRETTNIDIELNPTTANGLLLYTAYRLTPNSGDFLAISLANGYIFVALNLGYSLSTTLTSIAKVETGSWSVIRLERSFTSVRLFVNGQRVSTRVINGYTHLDTNSHFYLGGFPDLSLLNDRALSTNLRTAYEGCVRLFSINGITYKVNEIGAFDGLNVGDCDGTACGLGVCENQGTCHVTSSGFNCTCPEGFAGEMCQVTSSCLNRCLNGGTCTDLPGGSVQCSCMLGFTGTNCEIDLQLQSFSFSDNSYLSFSHPALENKQLLSNSLSFNFTTPSDGMLFWFGEAKSQSDSYFGVGVDCQYLTVVGHLGFQTEVDVVLASKVVADGRKHSVIINRRRRQLVIVLDGVTYEYSISGSLDSLSTSNIIFIGDFATSNMVKTKSLGHFSSKFTGCLENIELENYVLLDNMQYTRGSNLGNCGS